MLFLIFFLQGVFMSQAENAFYQQTLTTIEGQKTTLEQYKGKPLLIVNIATHCGYTPQLTGLERLYQKYKSKGLVVIGVPSNEFGGQTPENEKEVKSFCQLHHGVTFPLTSKTTVLGDKKSPLIEWLLKNALEHQEIAWNFEKFLINKNGQIEGRFKSSVKPEDTQFITAIEKIL